MKASIGVSPRVVLPVVTAVLTSLIVALFWLMLRGSAPSTGTHMVLSMPVYSTVEELAEASDAVVVGMVKGIAGHEVDYGEAREPGEQGISYTFYEVEVIEELRGKTDGAIVVARADPAQFPTESLSALSIGDCVVLFLGKRTATDAPSIKSDLVNQFYVTLSFDNGVFDVSPDGVARPRMPEAFALTTGGAEVGTLTYSLSEVRAKAQAIP